MMHQPDSVRMPWVPKRLGYLMAMGIDLSDSPLTQSNKMTCSVISMYSLMHYLLVAIFPLTPIAQNELTVKYCLVMASSGGVSFLLLLIGFVHYAFSHSLGGIRRCLSVSLLVVPIVCTLFLHGKAPFYLLSTISPTTGLYIGHRSTSVAALAVVCIFLTIIGVATEINPNLIGGIGEESHEIIWCDTAKLIIKMYIVLVSCFGNLTVVGYFTSTAATVQPPLRVLEVFNECKPRNNNNEGRRLKHLEDDQETYSGFFCSTLSLRGMAGLLSGMIFFVTGLCGTFLLRGSYEQNREDSMGRISEIAQSSTQLSVFESNVLLSRAKSKLSEISTRHNGTCMGRGKMDIAHAYWSSGPEDRGQVPLCRFNRSEVPGVTVVTTQSFLVFPEEELLIPDSLLKEIDDHNSHHELITCPVYVRRQEGYPDSDSYHVSVNHIYTIYPRQVKNPIDNSATIVMSCTSENVTYNFAMAVGDVIWKHKKYVTLGDSKLHLEEEEGAPEITLPPSWDQGTDELNIDGTTIPLGYWGTGLYVHRMELEDSPENYVRLVVMWVVVICGSAVSAWIVALALHPISKFTSLAHSFACGEQPLEDMNLPTRCFKELILLKVAIYRLASAVLEARHLVHPGALDCLENAEDGNDIGDSPMSARERTKEGGSPTIARATSPLMMSTSSIGQSLSSLHQSNGSISVMDVSSGGVSTRKPRGGLVSQVSVSKERTFSGSLIVSTAPPSADESSQQGGISNTSFATGSTNGNTTQKDEAPPLVITTPPTPRNDGGSEPSSASSPTNASQGILHYVKNKFKKNEKPSSNNLNPMASPSGSHPRSPRGKAAALSLLSHTPQNKDKETDKENNTDPNTPSMKKKNKAVRFSVDTKVQNLSPRHALNQVEATVLALNVSSFDIMMKSMKPQACIELFTEVFTFAVNAITESRGITITISGNRLLALWKCERSLKACECALLIQSYLKRRQNHVRVYIGISGGRVVWGNFSLSTPNSHGMTVVNVLGHPVNKAVSLERFNNQMNTSTLIDGYVYDKIADKPGVSEIIIRPVDIIHYNSFTSRREYPTPVYELDMMASELLPDDPAREYADGQPAGQFHFEAFRLALREEWEAADNILMRESTPVNSHVARLIQIVRHKRDPVVID
eukprot:TRINITY_DN3475_c0_g2_i1.p1 TRINITY_DN3475_c0_g2~~TRINITY_DN3475_c0_g2_i1.p1  ORF type:complete len:1140 (+),score=196.72 TRINITY_DN3475_c0_g2_i1:176-3595(+)